MTTKQTDQDRELIAAFIARNNITLCAPALAQGAVTTPLTKKDIAASGRVHRAWNAEHSTDKG